MKARKFSCILCLFLAVLMLSGCGGKGTTQPTAEKRDDIIMALNAEPSGLDPNMTWDTVTAVAQAAIYETLIAEKNGDSSTLEPMLAEAWEISKDGLEITFHLRQGVSSITGKQ